MTFNVLMINLYNIKAHKPKSTSVEPFPQSEISRICSEWVPTLNRCENDCDAWGLQLSTGRNLSEALCRELNQP